MINLHFYHLKLCYDLTNNLPYLLLVRCIETTPRTMIMLLLPDSETRAQDTTRLADALMFPCFALQRNHCIGVDVDILPSNRLPRPYEDLLNSVFTADDLTYNGNYFDLAFCPDACTTAMQALEDGTVPSNSVVCSQLLLVLLKLHPTPFFPVSAIDTLRTLYPTETPAEVDESPDPDAQEPPDVSDEERLAFLKNALNGMTPNKQAVVVAFCKVYNMWCSYNEKRFRRNRDLIGTAFVGAPVSPLIIEHISLLMIERTSPRILPINVPTAPPLFTPNQYTLLRQTVKKLVEIMGTKLDTLTISPNDKWNYLGSFFPVSKSDADLAKNLIVNIHSYTAVVPVQEQLPNTAVKVDISLGNQTNQFKQFSSNLECFMHASPTIANLFQTKRGTVVIENWVSNVDASTPVGMRHEGLLRKLVDRKRRTFPAIEYSISVLRELEQIRSARERNPPS